MRKLLYILFILPVISYSQNREYNFDIARELGVCFDELTPIEDDPEYYYPLCSDSTVRVFFLEPNYYCVYSEAIGWCGSCGCHMDLFRKDNNKYQDIGGLYCIGVDIDQRNSNYIIMSDLLKKKYCWPWYKAKIYVKDDKFHIKEIIFYDHNVSEFQLDTELDRKMHSDTCRYVDSLWILKDW